MITKNLGQKWIKPQSIWTNDEGPFPGAVAIQSNCGWLLLAREEEICDGPEAGQVRTFLVKPEELESPTVVTAQTP